MWGVIRFCNADLLLHSTVSMTELCRLPRFYVYLLLCREGGSIYTGYTTNLRRRFKQHNSPSNRGYTRRHRWHLLAVKCFLDRDSALLYEKQLKRWYHGRGNWTLRAWIRQAQTKLRKLCDRHGIQSRHLR